MSNTNLLNVPSVVEECCEPLGNCQGISHCLESGHRASCAQPRSPLHREGRNHPASRARSTFSLQPNLKSRGRM